MGILEQCALVAWSSSCRLSTLHYLINTLSTYMLNNIQTYINRMAIRMSMTRRGLPVEFPRGLGTGQWGAVNMVKWKEGRGWMWSTILDIGGDDPEILATLGMRCMSRYSAGAFVCFFVKRWLNVHLPLITMMQPMHETRIMLASSLGHLMIKSPVERINRILEEMSTTINEENKCELVLFVRGMEYYLQTFFALLSAQKGSKEDLNKYRLGLERGAVEATSEGRNEATASAGMSNISLARFAPPAPHRDYVSALLWVMSNIFAFSPNLPSGKDRDAVNRVCLRISLKVLCTAEAVSTVVENRALGVIADALRRVNTELPDADSLALAICNSLNSQFLCIRAGAMEVLTRAFERAWERGNLNEISGSFLSRAPEFAAHQITAYAVKGCVSHTPDLYAAFKPLKRSVCDILTDYCVDDKVSEGVRDALKRTVRAIEGIVECTVWEIMVGEGGGREALQPILKLHTPVTNEAIFAPSPFPSPPYVNKPLSDLSISPTSESLFKIDSYLQEGVSLPELLHLLGPPTPLSVARRFLDVRYIFDALSAFPCVSKSALTIQYRLRLLRILNLHCSRHRGSIESGETE